MENSALQCLVKAIFFYYFEKRFWIYNCTIFFLVGDCGMKNNDLEQQQIQQCHAPFSNCELLKMLF
jgi:hypothetical protein